MKLTTREREILTLVARGCTNQQAALELGLSKKTVESYLARIYLKLDVKNRTAAVARAIGELAERI